MTPPERQNKMAASVLGATLTVIVCSLMVSSEGHSLNKYTNGTDDKVGSSCNNAYCPTYCCYDDWSNWVCCSEYNVTDMWWFWFSFAVGLFLLSLCLGFCCRYRSQTERRRYLIITGERPAVVTTYGTEYVAPVMTVPPGYGTAGYMSPSPYAPAQLPAYTPRADVKGNPPKYS